MYCSHFFKCTFLRLFTYSFFALIQHYVCLIKPQTKLECNISFWKQVIKTINWCYTTPHSNVKRDEWKHWTATPRTTFNGCAFQLKKRQMSIRSCSFSFVVMLLHFFSLKNLFRIFKRIFWSQYVVTEPVELMRPWPFIKTYTRTAQRGTIQHNIT